MSPEAQENKIPEIENKSEISEKEAGDIDKVDSSESIKMTAENFKEESYQKDSIKLINIIKKKLESGNDTYYFEGINNLKDNEMGQKIANMNQPQVEALLKEYNDKNVKNPIQKESFLSVFKEKKQKITIIEDTKPSVSADDPIEKAQKVSEFVLSSEQKQNIQQRFSKIKNQEYIINKIKLIGKSSGDKVTENGKTKAKDAIDSFLKDLESKGFDIAALPNYENIQNQPWFNKEKEDKNPGNTAWAYGRALLQLTALSSEQLKAIPSKNIDFSIDTNDVEGDQATGGGIDFFGQSPGRTRQLKESKNEIANQWTDVDFFVRTVDGKGKDSYMNKYFKKEIKENKQTKEADVNVVTSFEQQDYQFLGTKGNQKSYIENYMIPKKNESGKTKLDGDTVYISLSPEQTEKHKNIIAKGKDISIEDLILLYKEVSNENNPKLNKLQNNYLAYEQKQSEINDSINGKLIVVN